MGAAAAGTSPMAVATAPQFEWVGNAAKVGMLAAATFTAATSARRGRSVRRLCLRDGLTGLLNRHAFDHCLEHLARRAERTDLPMTIAMIDIDGFMQLNDAHGRASGDAVLRWVAWWLKRSFRVSDLVCRYGGDTFVVAFVDSDNLVVLASRLESLRGEVEQTQLYTNADAELDVTVSIGMAQAPRDGAAFEAVLTRAGERLAEAKQAGRNRIEFGTIS
jgi:diguanylate cyclase (GGDEF)-like protein